MYIKYKETSKDDDYVSECVHTVCTFFVLVQMIDMTFHNVPPVMLQRGIFMF